MKILDLSHVITKDMPVFPGTPQPEIENMFTHKEHGFWEHKLTIFSHVGTHIDAPAHMIDGAETLDRMDVSRFMGPAMIIDCTTKNAENSDITIDDLAPFEAAICEHDFLIINTGWTRYWGTQEYFSHYPALTPEAASWLTDFNLKGIGLDTISADSAESGNYEVHKILLETGMVIIENLTNLTLLPENDFIFICQPLKYSDADGSPVRAIATVL